MMIRTLETLIYDCSNSTSIGPPKRTPQKKRSQKLVFAKLGGQDPLIPPPLPTGCALALESNIRLTLVNLRLVGTSRA